MCFVSKVETLHRREYLAKRIAYLCRRRYLPVEVPGADTNGKNICIGPLIGVHLHIDSLARELELDALKPEVLCSVHRVQETGDGKCDLVEEENINLLEARGGDPKNKSFQISALTSELKPAKVRKCDGCHNRHTTDLPLHITIGNMERQDDRERL
jgi:hypothetical protein